MPQSLSDTMSTHSELQIWHSSKLLGDDSTTSSAIIADKGHKWPLLIDPQEQVKR
jgi:ATP-binding dynein motor region